MAVASTTLPGPPVTRPLEHLWSPDEIARRLVVDFPDDPEMRVSDETIYWPPFVQGRGELRCELVRCLRLSHDRKPRGRAGGSGPDTWRTRDLVGLSEPGVGNRCRC
jgi:hypothetical protein